jgi:tetratricopeptide (TPR) repeat protein
MLRSAEILLAEAELQAGRPEEAYRRLRSTGTCAGGSPAEVGLELRSALPTLAEARLRIGEVAEAQACVEAGLRQARARHNRVGLVDLMRVQALILMEQERWTEAAKVLQEALQLARAMPYPYAEGRLRHAEGLLRLLTGERDQARRAFVDALAVFRRLGARWDAQLATRSLAVSRDGRSLPESRPVDADLQ